jgi:hypothetical protein
MFGYTVFKVHGYTYDPVANEIQSTGVIDIVTHPSGATIYIDEGEYGVRSNTIIRPEPGDHTLVIRKEEFLEYKTDTNVSLDKANLMEITLIPDPSIKIPEKVIKYVDTIYKNEYDSSKVALADHEHERVVILNTDDNEVTHVIREAGKVENAKWIDKDVIAFVQDKTIRIFNTITDSDTKVLLIPSNYKKYLGDNTRSDLNEAIPFMKGKEVQNFFIDWDEQTLVYNDTNSIHECSIKEETCKTLVRFSEPIVKTEYIENLGILIQDEDQIKLFDYEKTRKVLDTKTSIPFSYLQDSQEILFTKDGTLYRWKVFYK